MGAGGRYRGVFPPHPVTAGQVLAAARQIVSWNSKVLYGAAGLVYVVLQAPVFLAVGLLWPVGLSTLLVPLVLLTAVGQVFLTGYASVVVGRAVLGSPVTSAEVWAWLRPVLWRLVGLSALGGLGVCAGLVLGVVPGVLLGVVLSIAVPVFVLERTTVGEAFRRTPVLLRGAWWRTSALLAGVATVAGLFLLFMNYSTPLYRRYDALLRDDVPPTLLLATAALTCLPWSVLALPYTSVVAGLLYVDRHTAVTRTKGEP